MFVCIRECPLYSFQVDLGRGCVWRRVTSVYVDFVGVVCWFITVHQGVLTCETHCSADRKSDQGGNSQIRERRDSLCPEQNRALCPGNQRGDNVSLSQEERV